MKKLLLMILGVSMFFSCNKDFDELNIDTKNPSTVESGLLFAGATRQFSDAMVNTNVNRNIFRLLSQYWTETTYIDESQYDLATRSIPQNFWNVIYTDVLKNLKDAQTKVAADTKLSASEKANRNACIEIMTVYAYSVLVNTFGNVPYTEAIDHTNVHPKYDDAATIYSDLLTRLDAAYAAIDASSEGFGSSDLLYGGDMAGWKTLASSLKLRMAMVIADVDPTKAASAASSAISNGVISSNSQNVAFKYESGTPNTNPVWNDLIQSGRKDFVAANTIVDKMLALNDPRIPHYFTTDANGIYSGGEYGYSNNYATYSKPSASISNPSAEGVFIDYSEVEFLIAEAIARGFVSGDVEEHYNNAIAASVTYWGGTATEALTYIASPSVSYGSAVGDWRQKIGTQKWFALYNRGFEGWTEWRKFDYPVLNIAEDLTYEDIPTRYPYPVQEQNLNNANYTTAAAAVGGDEATTKLWWDKY
ncbi:MAG: SusD/RagB family nutrient-binding outer membrane lipoprotein [Saprospiraceae bacterium]|nr:SusD/RagB family nutrient-binding outer membrane lipoprotein [Saprospiraceae bacterium]